MNAFGHKSLKWLLILPLLTAFFLGMFVDGAIQCVEQEMQITKLLSKSMEELSEVKVL